MYIKTYLNNYYHNILNDFNNNNNCNISRSISINSILFPSFSAIGTPTPLSNNNYSNKNHSFLNTTNTTLINNSSNDISPNCTSLSLREKSDIVCFC